MTDDKHLFQLWIDPILIKLWKVKYERQQAKRISELMMKDLGLYDDMIDKELEEIKINIINLKERNVELLDLREFNRVKREKHIKTNADKIKALYPKGVGKKWKNSNNIAEKLVSFGIEATENEIYLFFEGDK